MPIQQISFQNTSIAKQNQQQNVLTSPVTTSSAGDTVEISNNKKEHKVLKYTLIGVGALLGIIAIAKHKSIAKIFEKNSKLKPEAKQIRQEAPKSADAVSSSSASVSRSSGGSSNIQNPTQNPAPINKIKEPLSASGIIKEANTTTITPSPLVSPRQITSPSGRPYISEKDSKDGYQLWHFTSSEFFEQFINAHKELSAFCNNAKIHFSGLADFQYGCKNIKNCKRENYLELASLIKQKTGVNLLDDITHYRFIGQSELDVIRAQKPVEPRYYGETFLTVNPKSGHGLSPYSIDYRVTFKNTDNILKNIGMYHNEEYSTTIKVPYTHEDVEKVEKLVDGKWQEVEFLPKDEVSKIQSPHIDIGNKPQNIDVSIRMKARTILENANIFSFYIDDLLPSINQNNIEALSKILEISKKHDRINDIKYIKGFLDIYSPKNKKAGLKLLDVINNTEQDFAGIEYLTIADRELKAPFFHIEDYIANANEINVAKLPKIIEAISKRENVICTQLTINKIFNYITAENADLLLQVLNEKDIKNNQFRFSSGQFRQIITRVGENNGLCFTLNKLLKAKDNDGNLALNASEITNVIQKLDRDTLPIFEKICNARFGSENDCSYSISEACNIFLKISSDTSTFEKAFDIALKEGHHMQIAGVGMGMTIENVNKNNIALFPLLLKMKVLIYNCRFECYKLNDLLSCLQNHPNIELLCSDSNKLEQFIEDFEELRNLKTKSDDRIFLPTPISHFTAIKKLLFLKYTDIVKYNQMMEFVKLAQEGKIPLYMFEKLSAFGEFNSLVISDIKKMQTGESIIPHFGVDTPLLKILHQTELADVVSVGERLYVNEGRMLTPLKMTEETYLKLFPPIERFACSQGRIGDCRFISAGINNSMINPSARIKLYKLFAQEGDDIVVTIPRYKEYPLRFLNGEIILPQNASHIKGALGLQMVEQGQARGKWLSEGNAESASLEKIMQCIDGGNEYKTIYGGKETTIGLPAGRDESGWTPFEIPSFEETLLKYSDRNKYLLSAGTKITDEKIEMPQDVDYNIFSNHAYSIFEINPQKKTVIVSNPWNTAEWVRMSYEKFKENFSQLFIEEI